MSLVRERAVTVDGDTRGALRIRWCVAGRSIASDRVIHGEAVRGGGGDERRRVGVGRDPQLMLLRSKMTWRRSWAGGDGARILNLDG